MKTKVLVTGATGFLGQNLVRKLKNEDYDVSAFGSLNKVPNDLNDVFFYDVDLRDKKRVQKLVKKIDPLVVFHLAASMKRVPIDREDVFAVNYFGFKNLLNDCDNCRRIINVSTAEVYGNCGNQPPFSEEMPTNFVSVYSESKLQAENLVKGDKKVITIRPAIIYGPGLSLSSPMFMAQLVKSYLSNDEFKMTKGEQTRDFIYVDDVVEACVLLAFIPNVDSQIFNVGSGIESRLSDVAKLVFNDSFKLRLGTMPCRDNEIMRYSLDITKLMKLGWKPNVDLVNGIHRYIGWAREQGL